MAKFFVNRGGGRAPEGPFEEAQIIRLIAAKKLTSGDVCLVGNLRFMALSQHPPFAQALREAGVEVPVEAVKPRARAPKGTNRGLLFAAVLCIFGLGIAAVAIGSYVMFSNGAMPIRAAVPTDTELLVEAQSVRELVSDFEKLRVVDPEKIIGKDPFAQTATALTEALAVPSVRSKELVLALTGAGFAARKLETEPEHGVFLSFTNGGAVNALLALPRFKYRGLVAKNGRKYTLSAATKPPPADANALERALFALSVDGQSATLVWFETSKILFWGSPSFAEPVARVLSLDVPGLEQSTPFRVAQPAPKNKPNISAYLAASKLIRDPRIVRWLPDDANHLQAFAGALTLVPEGVATHLLAHVDVGGQYTPTTPLELAQRLPAETLAYLAFTLNAGDTGAAREQMLLDRIARTDARVGAHINSAVDQLEAQFGFKLADFLGAFGDRAALSLVAPEDYSLALGDPRQLAQGIALEQIFAVKDEAVLRATLKAALTQVTRVPGLVTLKEEADGFTLTTVDGSLTAEARFADGLGLVAFGGVAPVARAVRAFTKKENTLDAQAAYHAARAATSPPTVLDVWLDAGRVLALTQNNPLLALQPGEPSFDLLGALRTAGPDRVTASFGVSRQPGSSGLDYRVEGLNLPLFAVLASLHGPALP